MALVKNGQVVADSFTDITAQEEIPATGALLVSLEQWQDHWQALLRRREPVGVLLRSDQHPEIIADDLDELDLVALHFPVFRDGRAYSYARLLRQQFGFTGEIRAVGDVLQDQLQFMHRVGFDAFEIAGDDPAGTWRAANREFSVCYQPAGDDLAPASQMRGSRSAD